MIWLQNPSLYMLVSHCNKLGLTLSKAHFILYDKSFAVIRKSPLHLKPIKGGL